MKMKIGMLALLFLPGILHAQVELSLEQCRQMALQNSKEIEIAGRQQEKAIFDTRSYRANYYPKLSVVGLGLYNQKKYDYKIKGGYLPTYLPDANGKLQPNVVVNPETGRPVTDASGNPLFHEYAFLPDIGLTLSLRGVYSAGVQLEQPVYMGGKVRTGYEMARVGETMAGENLRNNRSEVLLETERAYWQLLRVDEQAEAAVKYRETVGELLDNVTDAQQVGMKNLNDVLKVQVRYNEADLMVQKAENGKVLARMNLCRLLGLDLYTDIRLIDTLSGQVDARIWTLDSSVVQRPDYKLLRSEIELKEKQVLLTRADYLPQFGLTAGYGYGGGLKLNGQDEATATFTAMAALKIPVFNWGAGKNKIRAARLEEEISQMDLDRSVELMRLEIASARFNIEDAQTRIRMAKNALLQALENLKNSTDQYQVGMETLTSLLDAQTQWQQAWSQWIDAKAMLHLSESEYLRAIGQLEMRDDN